MRARGGGGVRARGGSRRGCVKRGAGGLTAAHFHPFYSCKKYIKKLFQYKCCRTLRTIFLHPSEYVTYVFFLLNLLFLEGPLRSSSSLLLSVPARDSLGTYHEIIKKEELEVNVGMIIWLLFFLFLCLPGPTAGLFCHPCFNLCRVFRKAFNLYTFQILKLLNGQFLSDIFFKYFSTNVNMFISDIHDSNIATAEVLVTSAETTC